MTQTSTELLQAVFDTQPASEQHLFDVTIAAVWSTTPPTLPPRRWSCRIALLSRPPIPGQPPGRPRRAVVAEAGTIEAAVIFAAENFILKENTKP